MAIWSGHAFTGAVSPVQTVGMDPAHEQRPCNVRFEWGLPCAAAVAVDADVAIVVDVLFLHHDAQRRARRGHRRVAQPVERPDSAYLRPTAQCARALGRSGARGLGGHCRPDPPVAVVYPSQRAASTIGAAIPERLDHRARARCAGDRVSGGLPTQRRGAGGADLCTALARRGHDRGDSRGRAMARWGTSTGGGRPVGRRRSHRGTGRCRADGAPARGRASRSRIPDRPRSGTPGAAVLGEWPRTCRPGLPRGRGGRGRSRTQ